MEEAETSGNNHIENATSPDTYASLLRIIASIDSRIAKIEEEKSNTTIKRLTSSVSTSALFLGLVLTFLTLYDALITKPEADRIAHINQFNLAVTSAAKARQELVQLPTKTTDPKLQLAISLAISPQIMTNISTARAMLSDLNNNDVGIPQLIVMTSEALTIGDMESAKQFVERAVSKTDATPYLHSEAKRYEGKYFFLHGEAAKARHAYQEALQSLGDSADTAASRAFVLADLVVAEYEYGDCAALLTEFKDLTAALQAVPVPLDVRSQLRDSTKSQLSETGGRCPVPDLNSL